MKSIKCLAVIWLLLTVSLSASVTITNFGSSADSDGGWTWNQGSSTLSGLEAAGALLFANSELTLDLTGYDSISITANVGTAPVFGFTFLIEDITAKTASAQFDWVALSGGATVIAKLTAIDEGFDFANVKNWNLISGSSGSNINAILTSAMAVSAIPEPAAWAGVLGVGALGVVGLRRRRRV